MAVVSNKTDEQPLDKSLVKLLIGQGISGVGDIFTRLAIAWFIVQTGSVLQMGINLSLSVIPKLILAPFLGNFVDRISRKKILWVSDLLRFALDVVLIVVILKGWFSIYLIYTYTVIKAILLLLYGPAQRAVIQQLSNETQRFKANALQQFSYRGSLVLGTLLAGLAVKYFDMHIVIAIDAVTFLISAFIILSIVIEENHILKARSSKSYFQQMREGFAYITANPWIILISFAFGFGNAGNSLAYVTRPFFCNQTLGLDASAYGLLRSLSYIGGLVASAILVRMKVKKHKLKLVTIGMLIWGVGFIGMSFTNNFFTYALISFVTFSAGPIMTTPLRAFYQNEIPSVFMGRVSTARTFIATLGSPIGYLFGSSIIAQFGIRATYVIAGIVVLIGVVTSILAQLSYSKLKDCESSATC